jgi:GT2 family glycosyltransferase
MAARNLMLSLEETADPVAFETFFVNLGRESDEALLGEFPDLKIFSLPGETEGRAGNQALELAAGRYIMPVDHDLLLQPNCLLRLVEFMDDNPDVGIAAPRILNAYGKPEPTVLAFQTLLSLLRQLWGKSRRTSFKYNGNGEVDWLWSGAKIIRRELIEDIGLPDAAMPPYFADMSYAFQAKKAGWHTFYIHAATALHPNPLKYDPQFINQQFSPSAAAKFMKKKWFG